MTAVLFTPKSNPLKPYKAKQSKSAKISPVRSIRGPTKAKRPRALSDLRCVIRGKIKQFNSPKCPSQFTLTSNQKRDIS